MLYGKIYRTLCIDIGKNDTVEVMTFFFVCVVTTTNGFHQLGFFSAFVERELKTLPPPLRNNKEETQIF